MWGSPPGGFSCDAQAAGRGLQELQLTTSRAWAQELSSRAELLLGMWNISRPEIETAPLIWEQDSYPLDSQGSSSLILWSTHTSFYNLSKTGNADRICQTLISFLEHCNAFPENEVMFLVSSSVYLEHFVSGKVSLRLCFATFSLCNFTAHKFFGFVNFNGVISFFFSFYTCAFFAQREKIVLFSASPFILQIFNIYLYPKASSSPKSSCETT